MRIEGDTMNDKNPGTLAKPVRTIDGAYQRMFEQDKDGILFIDTEVYKNIYE